METPAEVIRLRPPWQGVPWVIDSAPDGLGHTIRSVHSRRFAAAGDDFEERWSPWLNAKKLGYTTQWVLSQPLGAL